MENYLVYVTANDLDFSQDWINCKKMLKYKAGVSKIKIVVVIGEVKNTIDEYRESIRFAFEEVFSASDAFELLTVLVKGNIGRDFSSVKVGLDYVLNLCDDDDFIMIRNRSAHGPFSDNWYSCFQKAFKKDEQVGLVGNTINLMNHHKLGKDLTPHIQTYVYLSMASVLRKLSTDFPGKDEVDRLKLISKGEIGLSKRIMEEGYTTTSLFWPEEFFGNNLEINDALPRKDIKKKVDGLPFKHRKAFRNNWFVRSYKSLCFYLFQLKYKHNESKVEIIKTGLYYD